ncbi:MAG: S8 family serine peptidase [Candidatus Omnitrophota bacterium]
MRNSKILIIMVLGLFCWLGSNAFAAAPIRVAILDSGSNIGFKEGVNFVDDTLKDFNGHGTLMSKIIKEACPGAEFYIVKVIGKNGLVIHEDAVILGLEWAISRNVKVINMSLRIKPSEMLNAVIKKAHEKGIILVSAAGNNDRHSDSYYSALEARGFAGSNHGFNADVAYPAKYPEVIAVGALDKYGKIYDQSVQSERVDLYFKGYYGRKAGTSVASAQVAGTIARVLAARAGSGDRTKFIAQERQMLELIDSVELRCSKPL